MNQKPGNRLVKNKQAAGEGRRRAFRAERPSKEQTRLCPEAFASGGLYFFFFLPRMLLFDFQEYREPYSECAQKYQFLSIKKNSLGASSMHETRDGTFQSYYFL